MALERELNGGLSHYRVVVGVIVVSAGTFLALTLWNIFKNSRLDDDASQLCRLVSPRRSKDDDKRVQLKRRRGSRLGSNKSCAACNDSEIFKRQNTM